MSLPKGKDPDGMKSAGQKSKMEIANLEKTKPVMGKRSTGKGTVTGKVNRKGVNW